MERWSRIGGALVWCKWENALNLQSPKPLQREPNLSPNFNWTWYLSSFSFPHFPKTNGERKEWNFGEVFFFFLSQQWKYFFKITTMLQPTESTEPIQTVHHSEVRFLSMHRACISDAFAYGVATINLKMQFIYMNTLGVYGDWYIQFWELLRG